jgi:hypothetical protein
MHHSGAIRVAGMWRLVLSWLLKLNRRHSSRHSGLALLAPRYDEQKDSYLAARLTQPRARGRARSTPPPSRSHDSDIARPGAGL